MSDNKITQDQLEPNVMEELESGIGDLNTLNTENKGSLVAAVTEIYGKSIIANAIGEPLALTDTFTEMSSEINGLLSTFKSNMMNAGVVVESGDKFKALIDKIQGLTEGEGNKGIQIAEGTQLVNKSGTFDVEIPITTNLDFTPTYIFAIIPSGTIFDGYSSFTNICVNNLETVQTYSKISTYGNNPWGFDSLINDISSSGFNVNIHFVNGTGLGSGVTLQVSGTVKWYAIGVGEEDTALRDSLADILENKGVDVTEEDNMASLITKVDNELNNIKQNLVDALVNKGIANAGEYSFEDLINNINDFYVLRAGAGNTISVAKNTTLVTNNTTSFKLAYTSPTIGEDYLEGTYRCYCYIYTNIGGTNYAIAEAKIEHIRNESVIASATLSQPTTDTTKHSYDFKNVKRGDYFKFYIRNSVDRSYEVSMNEKGITYDEVFIKNINE